MGMAMVAGIMGMIEISNSLSSSSQYLIIPENLYLNSEERTADSHFLKALTKSNNTWGNGKIFCQKLKQEAISMGHSTLISKYDVYENTPTAHPRLLKPCILMKGNHRVLISTDISNINPYNYYSCLLKNEAYCNFEQGYD